MKFELGEVTIRKPDRLPHWDAQHGIYFVTFNLFDAVPVAVQLRIREEANAQLAHIHAVRGAHTAAEKQAIDAWVQAQIGEVLDETHGCCFMRDRRIAEIVANAITFFDERRYRLFAWCVMPNHVHAVMTLFEGETMDKVIHS